MKLVCPAGEDCPGMLCTFDADLRIFLDKRRSPLVARMKKGSKSYQECAWVFTNREQKNVQYMVFGDLPYNVGGDYFVGPANIKSDIYCRTHPDFVAYVGETDQNKYKTVDIPEGKTLTETHVGDGYCTITVSDGDVQVF